jgi:hypothetical protein
VTRASLEQVEREVKGRFSEGAALRVQLLQYGEDPAVEPGRVGIRVGIEPTLLPENDADAMDAFHHANRASIKQLRHDLPGLAPEVTRLEFVAGDKCFLIARLGTEAERSGDLTPVMARLGSVDLETLDTLITAGIAPNRAEAVRWVLARSRERPAYEQLRQRGREIEELKAQF